MKERLLNLIDVKSIMTFSLTVGFIFACFFSEHLTERAFEALSSTYTIVVAFYFGTQYSKKTSNKDAAVDENHEQNDQAAE